MLFEPHPSSRANGRSPSSCSWSSPLSINSTVPRPPAMSVMASTEAFFLAVGGARTTPPRPRQPGCTGVGSGLVDGEGIAALDGPVRKAGREPALALLGGAMREGIGHDIALRPPLQTIVADGRSGLQSLIDIARLEEIMLLLRMIRPYTG